MATAIGLKNCLDLFTKITKSISEKSKTRLITGPLTAIDTETTGLDTYSAQVQATYLSWYNDKGLGKAFPVGHKDQGKLINLASDKSLTKLMYNAKFDVRILNKTGIFTRGKLICVLLMAQMSLPDEKNKKLKHLARKFLNDPCMEEHRLAQWRRKNKIRIDGKLRLPPFSDVPKHILDPYNLADSRLTVELFTFLSAGMDEYKLWPVLEREMALMRKVVLPMENYGMMIDLEEVDRLRVKTTKTLKKIKDKLVKLTGNPTFNPNSSPQVAKEFYKDHEATRFSSKTGAPKVDIIAILEQPSKLGTLVAKYRKIQKANSTYLKNFNKKIIHASFNQGGTRTGRFSSSEPNLQNIPRPDESSLLGKMRRCFVARPKCRLLFIDYEQIELRLTAHFSGEQHMLEAINEGHDLHSVTCRLLFNKDAKDSDFRKYRYLAKTLNFAVIYGTGPQTFMETVLRETDGVMRISLIEAASYIDIWKEKHPAIVNLFDEVAKEVSTTGGVTNHYGRYMPVDSYKSYVGVNYKVQGTAADFIKRQMFKVCHHLEGHLTQLILQVHDELGFNWHPSEKYLAKELRDIMEEHDEFSVPITCSVEYGKNWHDKKELKL